MREDSESLVRYFANFAKFVGLIKANDKPDDYYGSVEHQRDLFTRLGLQEEEWDPNDDAVYIKWKTVWIDAQISGKDASGEALYEGDFAILGALTGYSL